MNILNNFRLILDNNKKKCNLHQTPGGGNGNSIHSCLENPMDRGAWWASVHRVAKSQT